MWRSDNMFSAEIPKNYSFAKMNDASVLNMSCSELYSFLKKKQVPSEILSAIKLERIDGKALLIMSDRDMNKLEHKYHLLLGDMKRFLIVVNTIQQQNRNCLVFLGILDNQNNLITNLLSQNNASSSSSPPFQHHPSIYSQDSHSIERISPANSVDGGSSSGRQFATCIQPELFKTTVSLGEYVDGSKKKVEKVQANHNKSYETCCSLITNLSCDSQHLTEPKSLKV